MLITQTRIVIEQDNSRYAARTNSFQFNFVNECRIVSSWANLTDTAKIVFPKNIYFVDSNGKKINWEGKNVVEDPVNPLLLRGDRISIYLGYIYNDAQGNQVQQMNLEFKGYITKINNRIPLEIECEDNMYRLKQIQAPNKVFPASTYDLQKIMEELMSGTGFTARSSVPGNTFSTNIGDLRTANVETVAQVLERLQKDYHIESYFRGDELRCSGFVYFPADRVDHRFHFQNNVISDSLNYVRKDDVRIGAKAYAINGEDEQSFNAYGYRVKKKKRLEVVVGDKDGEIRTLYFLNVKTEAELKAKAQERLNRLYYAGFTGQFRTFGFPSVKHGDSATFVDHIIPERTGTYLIKQVEKVMSVTEGFKQDITIDIRIDTLTASEIALGL